MDQHRFFYEGATKENSQNLYRFLHFSGPCKNWPETVPNKAKTFPTNPNFADILGGRNVNYDITEILCCECP